MKEHMPMCNFMFVNVYAYAYAEYERAEAKHVYQQMRIYECIRRSIHIRAHTKVQVHNHPSLHAYSGGWVPTYTHTYGRSTNTAAEVKSPPRPKSMLSTHCRGRARADSNGRAGTDQNPATLTLGASGGAGVGASDPLWEGRRQDWRGFSAGRFTFPLAGVAIFCSCYGMYVCEQMYPCLRAYAHART